MDKELFNDYISQGIELMSVGNYEAAKVVFEKALEINRRSYEAYIHLGNAYANLEKYDDAVKEFQNALLLEPKSAEALFSIGNAYLLNDNMLKAVEYFIKAEEAGMNEAILYQLLAGIFNSVDDFVQAMRYINKAIAASPLDGELRLYKIQLHLDQGNNIEALEALEDMQKILPDAFALYNLKAKIYISMKDFTKALAVAEEGYKRFPTDENIAFTKLSVLVESGKDAEALNFAQEMKDKGLYDEVVKQAAIRESTVYIRTNNLEKAEAVLKYANEKLGKDVDITYLLMDLYGFSVRHEDVIACAKELLEMNPNPSYDATARYFIAHSLDKMGKDAEAKNEYRKLTSYLRRITTEHGVYEAYIYRLLSHTRLGEYDKALELADYLEGRRPDRADAHTFRYFIYNASGDVAKANEAKAKALAINPDVKL